MVSSDRLQTTTFLSCQTIYDPLGKLWISSQGHHNRGCDSLETLRNYEFYVQTSSFLSENRLLMHERKTAQKYPSN